MEENKKTYTLVASTNSGRYALDDPVHGADVSSGMPLYIYVGGTWTIGHVEHQGLAYAGSYGQSKAKAGYVFIAQDGSVVGLCVGMRVKL